MPFRDLRVHGGVTTVSNVFMSAGEYAATTVYSHGRRPFRAADATGDAIPERFDDAVDQAALGPVPTTSQHRPARLVGAVGRVQAMTGMLLLLLNELGVCDVSRAAAEAMVAKLVQAETLGDLVAHTHQTLSYDACRYHRDVMGKGLETK
eukprot:6972335-Prymnesium_polylepis.1